MEKEIKPAKNFDESFNKFYEEICVETEISPQRTGSAQKIRELIKKRSSGVKEEKKANPLSTASGNDDDTFALTYFRTNDRAVRCYNCGKIGHISSLCMEPNSKAKQPCFLCGTPGHTVNECPDKMCMNCGETGHNANRCPRPLARKIRCRLCFELGHNEVICPHQDFRKDRARGLKKLRCFACGRTGHACCAKGELPVTMKGLLFCFNCGEQGHDGEVCGAPRQNQLRNSERIVCFRCGANGHMSRNCPKSSNSSSGRRLYSSRDRRWDTATPRSFQTRRRGSGGKTSNANRALKRKRKN